MTVQELKEEKENLKRVIGNIMLEFTNQTGVKITSMCFSTVEDPKGEVIDYSVNPDLEI